MSKARKSPTATVPAATNTAPDAPHAPHVAPTGELGLGAEVTAKAGSPRPPTPTSGDKSKTGGAAAKRGGKQRSATVARPAKPKPAKAPKAEKPKRLSCLDAAAQVLASAKEPMKAKDMIEAMGKKGLWSSPNGKTPEASLYAAIIREIASKGVDGRFVKKDRGLFAAAK